MIENSLEWFKRNGKYGLLKLYFCEVIEYVVSR